MPGHFHAILVPQPPDSISQAMRYIKGTSARMINARRAAMGPVWQPRFYDRGIKDEQALEAAVAYIEANPEAAALALAADYLYSSANPRWPTDIDAYFGDG